MQVLLWKGYWIICNLYKGFPWNSIFRDLRKSKTIWHIIMKVNSDVITIFITSGPSILLGFLYLKTIN